LAKHIISKNKDNIPKYKNTEKNTWEDIPRDKANKYYPNLYYTFDEKETQKSLTELMNLAKDGYDHKTIGIITGGWGDYASLGFSLSFYE
jgi:predicted solute-binding protein